MSRYPMADIAKIDASNRKISHFAEEPLGLSMLSQMFFMMRLACYACLI